jgi:AcrR family transcriptional regulator
MIAAMNRTTVAEAALDLIREEGLDALTMRTLAHRIGVKAASLYWHVRDRQELLELVADALLARVPVRGAGRDWRQASVAMCMAAGAEVATQRDGDRILLGGPGAVRRSAVYARLVSTIASLGVEHGVAREVAAMMLGFMVTQPSTRFAKPSTIRAKTVTLAIDSGSRGVVVQAGGPMEALFRVPLDRSAAAPAVVRGERVVVRRLRGGKRGEIEVNPSVPWRLQVQGPTWNTLLDLRGINLREVHLDSGASKVECVLPSPRGVVPINVSGGVIRVTLKRPPGTAVVADISSGAVQISLDDFHPRVAIGDVRWETPGASAAPDRYELHISGGAVRVSLDQSAPQATPPIEPALGEVGDGAVSAALGVLLDGIAERAGH